MVKNYANFKQTEIKVLRTFSKKQKQLIFGYYDFTIILNFE